MNKVMTSMVSICLSLIIGYILYDNMVVANETRLNDLKGIQSGKAKSGQSEEEKLIAEYTKLKKEKDELISKNKKLESDKYTQKLYTRSLLTTGVNEAKLISKILSAQPKQDEKNNVLFKICELKTGELFFYDNEDEEIEQEKSISLVEQMADNGSISIEDEKEKRKKELEEKLKNLDDSGNLKGAEVDDGSWKGIEILPVTLKFKGTYKGMIYFMSNLETFPYHFVRSLDTVFTDNNNINGTLILSFPLSDKQL